MRSEERTEDNGFQAVIWLKRKPIVGFQPQPLPLGLIPSAFQGYVADLSEQINVPIEFVAVPLIIAAGSTIGRKVAIRPKQFADWYEICNLWGALVAEPGLLKSAALEGALVPLRKLARKAREEYEESLKASEPLEKGLKLDIVGLERELKKLRPDSAEKREELFAKEQELKQVRPIERRYIVNDATTEKLAIILQDNHNGVLQLRDELTAWLASMEKPGREGDRAFFLESWNGKNAFSVDRISRESVHVSALTLSVLGTIQPGPLRGFVAEAFGGSGGSDGLLQRFSLLAVCVTPPPFKDVDRLPDLAARERVERIFENLSGEILSPEEGTIPYLRFDPDAQKVFNQWREELEERLRDDQEHPAFISWLSKHRKLVPALALIFHLIETASEEIPPSVSEQAMTLAAAWTEVFESHARWVYEPPRMTAAQILVKRIEQGRVVDGMTIRDIAQRRWSNLTTADEVRGGLAELIDAGWARIEEFRHENGGRSAEVVRLHPDLKQGRST